MKKLEAMVRVEKLEEIKQLSCDLGLPGMTVTMVSGFGTQKGKVRYYRGTEFTVNLLPKAKVEIVLPDSRAEEVTDALIGILRTGEIGDGKIFIYDVRDCVRIRTGEHGEIAL